MDRLKTREDHGQYVVKTGLGVGGEESLSMIPGFLDYITGRTVITPSEFRSWEGGPVGERS